MDFGRLQPVGREAFRSLEQVVNFLERRQFPLIKGQLQHRHEAGLAIAPRSPLELLPERHVQLERFHGQGHQRSGDTV
jgi:hypothetical protein